MTDQWTDRLSEYLDGELDEPDRLALEAHLADCAACRTTVRQLEQVVWRARALPDRAPAVDLWPAIAARAGIASEGRGHVVAPVPPGRSRSPRRFSFTVPQLLAAGIALAFVSGGTVWLARAGGANAFRSPPPSAAAPTGQPVVNATLASFGDAEYELAVTDLERVLAEHRDALDPATVRVLEENLATIDRAIEEARRALEADPANAYLNGHLADNLRRKMQLLRRATAFVSAQT